MARKGGSRRCAVPGCKRCTLVPPFCKRHRSGAVDRSALPGIVGALDPNLGRFLRSKRVPGFFEGN